MQGAGGEGYGGGHEREKRTGVRLVLDTRADAGVREDAFKRSFGVARHDPVAHRRFVRNVEFVGADHRACRTTRVRHGVKPLAIAPAEEKPVAALRALKRKRLAYARTCSCDKDIHA